MAMKLAILFLGALVLAQGTWSVPTSPEDKIFDELDNIFKEIGELSTIIEISMDGVLELNAAVKREGKVLLHKVLEDPKVIELKGDEAEKYVKEIRDYAVTLDNEDNTEKTHPIEYLNFKDLIDKFKKENKGTEAKVIGNSLMEHGLENFEKNILDVFGKFAKEDVEKIDASIKKLDAENKKDKKIIDWYNKLVAEEDLYKKLIIFEEFFGKNKKD